MVNKLDLTGIILAGGKSTRLSFNKIKLSYYGIPLFIIQAIRLSYFCSEILIVVSSENKFYIQKELSNLVNCKKILILEDEKIEGINLYSSIGPIMGLYTGLKHASNIYSFVLAFDMPFIEYKFLNFLVDKLKLQLNYAKIKNIKKVKSHKEICKVKEQQFNIPFDAMIVKTLKGFEVLSGIYSKNCLSAIYENIILNNFKISEIFNKIEIKIIYQKELEENGIDLMNFFNINNYEDLKRYKNFCLNYKIGCENFDGKIK